MGVMTIAERDGRLFASIGGLSAPLEPYTEPETARVELIPGTGAVIRFGATSLIYDDEVFTRLEK